MCNKQDGQHIECDIEFPEISCNQIDWKDYAEAIPAFFTMLLMPLAYSISDGIMMGVIIYVFINLVAGNFRKLNITLYVLAVLFIAHYIVMLLI